MAPKRSLRQSKYSFHTHPFEAICCGSWQSVELIRIIDGTMTIKFVDEQHAIEGKGPVANLRLRSRRATVSDCTCFLRPGVDVCVFLDPKHTENSDTEDQNPVWVDAKISSIKRKPHEAQCTCQFYVSLFIDSAPLGAERGMISKETSLVGIDQISILQKLQQFPCESEHYRWSFPEDCSVLPRTKLLLGKFSSDLSWLLVSSVLKHTPFNVRSFQNKIVYQIMDGDDDCLKGVSFKVEEDGVSTPIVVKFAPVGNVVEDTSRAMAIAEPEPLPCHAPVVDLRRSKRRNVQPERFLGCDGLSDDDGIPTGTFRNARPVELPDKNEEDEEKQQQQEEEDQEEEEDLLLPLSSLFRVRKRHQEEEAPPKTKDLIVYQRKKKRSEVIATPTMDKLDEKDRQSELAIVPFTPSQNPPLVLEKYQPDAKRNGAEASSSYYTYKSSTVKKKNVVDLDDMDIDSKWKGKASNKKVPRQKYRSMSSRREAFSDSKPYQKRTLSAGAYFDLINSYMKEIDSTVLKKEEPGPLSIKQWKESEAAKCVEQKEESEASSSEDEGEESETEMLWKEMELAMASAYIFEDNVGPNDEEPTEILKKSSKGCKHDFKLDEEIGIICRLCGIVSTEIKDVSPPFMQTHYTGYNKDNQKCDEDSESRDNGDDPLYPFRNREDPETPSTEEHENVWALIPELRRKLHLHQKKAFEFLWKNIAGSLEPSHMKPSSKSIGGCVVSHTPGAGKTFLIIAFLVSYLKLFPGKRPLVLAPKTTLYTWYKECIKWEIPIPVHLIHGRKTFRVCRQKPISFRGPKPSNDVMHILDCLEKIQKWHAHPSVLVMGYTSFLTLMREDSKFQHRKYMAKVLRESPGILILDEGHNPRSTKSRCRKVLMKVETELRILLSGTLFQNNFCEYFNTLCLARPKFMDEVLKELDPKSRKKWKKSDKARHLIESRARKFFLDNIAKKIDSSIGEERLQGLNMLRNITSGFIDVYEGGAADNLPGLQSYTLLMNSTSLQDEILLKLHAIMAKYNGYPLELELLITLGSIHPSLVRTSNCAGKFFSSRELENLENHKADFRKGSKVMFVLNLVFRVCENEKVLIFCHNIAPITMFVELFETLFKWRKGKEVLVLTGDLELFERGKVMDKFEDPRGSSKILLASITACAEGISLTAASRVILLDSEWNPSKTKQAIARAFRPGQMKVVYVYQLLATGTLEEDKYRRTTWKEWVSNMIFSEAFVEDATRSQAEKIEDDILRDMVEVDRVKSIHMIMKNEKKSTL